MGTCLTTLGISRIPCPVSLAGPLGRVASPSCHDCPSSAKADPADESHDAGRLVFGRQSTTTTSPSSIIPCRDIPWPDETVSRLSNFSMPLLRFSFVPIRQSQTKGSARRFAHAFGVPRPASGRDRGANNDARRQCCHADAALARCHLALTLTLTLTLTRPRPRTRAGTDRAPRTRQRRFWETWFWSSRTAGIAVSPGHHSRVKTCGLRRAPTDMDGRLPDRRGSLEPPDSQR